MKTGKIALHWQMGIALILGILGGFIFSNSFYTWGNVIYGIAKIFLHAINMIVIPLVFLSTVLGISTMKASKSMGRIAAKSFLYFIITAILAAFVGILVTNILRPGYGAHNSYIKATQILSDAKKSGATTLMDKIVDIVPNNIFEAFSSGDILPIIFFSILLGYFVTKIQEKRQNTVNDLLESLNEIIMRLTNFIISFAPIGVFSIVIVLVGKQAHNMEALKNCLMNFAFFVIVVWISLVVMGGMILPLLVGLVAHIPAHAQKSVDEPSLCLSKISDRNGKDSKKFATFAAWQTIHPHPSMSPWQV